MALITTADERLKQDRGVKMLIVGPSGIGKTSLLWSLDPATTLMVDMEAGMKAVEGWQGDSIDVRSVAQAAGVHPWEFLRDLACLISGPNPAVLDAAKPYSRQHFDYCVQKYGDRRALLGKYKTIFFDSITQTARYAFSWAQTQPQAFSEKTGKPDTRGAYGLLGQIMVGGEGLLSHLQHSPDMNIVMVGILNQVTDEFGRKSWKLQVDGGKTEMELPGIVDEIISMVEMDFDGNKHRAFVCHTINQWGYPAKDRSGRLDLIEEPNLGKLIEKMRVAPRQAATFAALPTPNPTPAPAEPAADPNAPPF